MESEKVKLYKPYTYVKTRVLQISELEFKLKFSLT
jgi:hypothetical protein